MRCPLDRILGGMVEMSAGRFEELVSEALDAIPERLTRLMDNVVILVEDVDPADPSLLGCTRGSR